jgi:hypothetical protein
MKVCVPAWCVMGLLIGTPSLAPAQALPELLIPVDKTSAAEFAQPHNFHLRRSLFYAKSGRYRIVKINFDLLDKENATFTITPFPESPLRVQAKASTSESSPESARQWQLRVLDPALAFGTAADGRPVSATLLDRLNTLTLTVHTRTLQVPIALKKKLLTEAEKDSASKLAPSVGTSIGPSRPGTLSLAAVSKMRVTVLVGRWRSGRDQSDVRLEPIEDDPRYHVVYEVDPKKLGAGSFEKRIRPLGEREYMEKIDREQKQYEKENGLPQ